MLKNKLQIFFLALLLLLPILPAQAAADLKMGEECPANADERCISGDCEISTKAKDDGSRIWYCDCNDDADCNFYNDTNNQQSWNCIDGMNASFDVDYCLGTDKKTVRFPAGTDNQQSALSAAIDFITDPEAASKIVTESITKDLNDKISIKIPGLNFSNLTGEVDSEGYLNIPWIGQYISAVYNFGMVAASILAVIMIILQGVKIVTSGGGEGKTTGYKRITQIVVGLIILWGSYAALYTINPALVSFQALKIKYVEPISMDSLIFDKDPEDSGVLPTTANTEQLDKIFRSYAACYGYDWRLLKAFAAAESGLRSNSNFDNKRPYKGLFQMNLAYCEGGLKYGSFPSELNFECTPTNLFDPELNTAATAATVNHNLKQIKAKCKSIGFAETLVLLYIGHNNGPGVMNYVADGGGCDFKKMEELVGKYYKTHKSSVTLDHGLRKFNYALSVVLRYAKEYGADTAFPSDGLDNSICPIKTKKRVSINIPDTNLNITCGSKWNGRKVLAIGDSNTEYPSSYADYLKKGCSNLTIEKRGYFGKSADFIYDTIKDRNLRAEGFTDIIVWAGVNNITGARSELKKIYDKARANGLRVIAITITPWEDYGSWSKVTNPATVTQDVNTWIKSFSGSDGYVVVDVYKTFENPNNFDALNPELARDKIHLNAKGQGILADIVAKQAFSD